MCLRGRAGWPTVPLSISEEGEEDAWDHHCLLLGNSYSPKLQEAAKRPSDRCSEPESCLCQVAQSRIPTPNGEQLSPSAMSNIGVPGGVTSISTQYLLCGTERRIPDPFTGSNTSVLILLSSKGAAGTPCLQPFCSRPTEERVNFNMASPSLQLK